MKMELTTNNLYIRPGEQYVIEPMSRVQVEEYERVYAVALVEVPPPPYVGEYGTHEGHLNFTVIAAEFYPTIDSQGEWKAGWVTLGPDEKKGLGLDLVEMKAVPGTWYRLILDTRKYREE